MMVYGGGDDVYTSTIAAKRITMELKFGNKDPNSKIVWELTRNGKVTLRGETSSNKKFTTGLDSNISHWSLGGYLMVKATYAESLVKMPKGGMCVSVKRYNLV